jgi:thiosulfate/3-mercaptopyruvate sulfurtransferase
MVFDCSFDLMKPDSGAQQYAAAHIPGAHHANLDTDLSARHGVPGAHGEVVVAQEDGVPASGGRHPLPSREKFAMWLSSVGFANDMQAVVYDRNGANYCGRLWWMLKWAGHDAVAVLDGGLQAWQAAGGEVTGREEPAHFQSNFDLGEPLRTLVTTTPWCAGSASLTRPDRCARRCRVPRRGGTAGPVAGHIPGALNRPFAAEHRPDGKFKPASQLRAEFEALLAGRDPASVVHHCGSGVSAVPNLLAMESPAGDHRALCRQLERVEQHAGAAEPWPSCAPRTSSSPSTPPPTASSARSTCAPARWAWATPTPASPSGHADLDATFSFNCTNAAAAKFIDVNLFTAFKGLRQIDSQIATAQGQFKRQLKRPAGAQAAQPARLGWGK